MKTEKDIDKVFKHRLDDSVNEPMFNESDWETMEQMLDENKKRPAIIYWLPALSSAAAILLFLGWWLFKPQVTVTQKMQQQVAVNHVQKEETQTVNQQHIEKNNIEKAQIEKSASTSSAAGLTKPQQQEKRNNKPEFLANNSVVQGKAVGRKPIYSKQNNSNSNKAYITDKGFIIPVKSDNEPEAITTRDAEVLAAVIQTPEITSPDNSTMPAVVAVQLAPQETAGNPKIVDPVAKKIKRADTFRPQYGITVLASSEVNGVGSFQQTNSGSNYGVLFSAELIKRFTISTGASYSLKPYTMPFDDYHTTYNFKNSPQTVNADCRVLDIPINIDYALYNKHRNKISVGTGLSSYIMMHESYTYNYGNSNTLYGPSYYAVKGKGKYFFSIMNLEASYQRQINSKVGISFEPYLKVPLSAIGYSQVRVETFGMAVGLNWNLNSLTKPK